jgi:hypothetical protein
VAIWYISPVLVYCIKKIWQPCSEGIFANFGPQRAVYTTS